MACISRFSLLRTADNKEDTEQTFTSNKVEVIILKVLRLLSYPYGMSVTPRTYSIISLQNVCDTEDIFYHILTECL
jgi:hypothetical protein